MMREHMLRIVAPVVLAVVLLAAWQMVVTIYDVPPYLVPSPLRVAQAMIEDRALLFASLWVTLQIALTALAIAIVAGVGVALVFAQSRIIEASLLPYAILLQVTPIVAIAPLIIIWVEDTHVALVLCAVVAEFVAGTGGQGAGLAYQILMAGIQLNVPRLFAALVLCAAVVALFPVIANTTLGLRSVDAGLRDLFRLARATRWQTLWRLKVPSALPYFFGGLRIASGLALIGAVVAEVVSGTWCQVDRLD